MSKSAKDRLSVRSSELILEAESELMSIRDQLSSLRWLGSRAPTRVAEPEKARPESPESDDGYRAEPKARAWRRAQA